MERKVTIVDTATQYNNTFDSNATTLAELKNELRALGVNFDGKDFREGISRTVLIDDASQLPSNLMYKGQPTNDLVIVLTAGKIKSGMCMSRSSVYLIIKEEGLADAIKEKTGKNYTNLPTEVLLTLINEFDNDDEEIEEEESNDSPSFPSRSIEAEDIRKLVDTFFAISSVTLENYIMLRNISRHLNLDVNPVPQSLLSLMDLYGEEVEEKEEIDNNTKYSNEELNNLIEGVL